MYLSAQERHDLGHSRRSRVSRSALANFVVDEHRPDPVALLQSQDNSRISELLPIRYGRMLTSPFAFFRGAALIMASDLAGHEHTGLDVQLCGDAHLSNFGLFASAERSLVFDVNDFDETLPGPWEWDVKRLVASLAVAGRDNGFGPKRRAAIMRQAVSEYRQAIRDFAGRKTLDVWYARASVGDLRELLRSQATASEIREFDKTVEKGRRKDS